MLFIEDQQIVEKILRHLALCETCSHDPPAFNVLHIPETLVRNQGG